MRGEKKMVITVLAVVVLAGAFWMLLLSPKREEAAKLSENVETLEASLSQHEAEAANALAAKKEFPTNYSQLVVLGKAVPADSETASLLVQVQHISEKSHVRFEEITLESEGGEAAPAATETEGSEAATGPGQLVSPTEVAASTSPLGASVGPAGLSEMPYTLTFTGDFFHVANFIHGLDSLVKTTNSRVAVDGRLITVNSFSLSPAGEAEGSGESAANAADPKLSVSFSITTYLTPPEQGLTAGATPEGPAPLATGTQASSTIGGNP
ncbi:MAG TPA: type 4a pilus biogenesis protein PilO [Solirubrobacterales bacterium]|nr:type 4a pilus biogenesis protein PilO [Solirubrobacterales bacterium]